MKELLNHIYSILSKYYNLLNLYCYGSRVYGNFRETSDYDFIALIDDKSETLLETQLNFEIDSKEININLYNLKTFLERLETHSIDILECLYLSEDLKIEKFQDFKNFELDLEKLRVSISSICSNSYVKAKKKLTIEKDFDVLKGKKSLWHVFRIYNFGIQLATLGKIVDYFPLKEISLFDKIMNFSNDWESLQKEFQPLRNFYASEFKKLTTKPLK